MTDASPFPADIRQAAAAVLAAPREAGWTVATAESCTGGLVAASLTEIAGSSDVVEGGVVTYSNALKALLLINEQLEAELAQLYAAVSDGGPSMRGNSPLH